MANHFYTAAAALGLLIIQFKNRSANCVAKRGVDHMLLEKCAVKGRVSDLVQSRANTCRI